MPSTSDRAFVAQFVSDLDHDGNSEFDGLPGWLFKNFVCYIDIPEPSARYANNHFPNFIVWGTDFVLNIQPPLGRKLVRVRWRENLEGFEQPRDHPYRRKPRRPFKVTSYPGVDTMVFPPPLVIRT